MSSTLDRTAGAPSSGRLRHQRAADGVVAAYIHEISRSPRPAAVAAPAAAPSRAGVGARPVPRGSRLRAANRRPSHAPLVPRLRAANRRPSHAPLVPRPLVVNAACPGA
jgi:hypothetical protein